MVRFFSYDYYQVSLYDQPLGYRAWVLQERLLSPRVLSFGLGEAFWDCIETPNASESLPRGFNSVGNYFSLKPKNLAQKAIPVHADIEEIKSFWWSILEEYTDRELTYPETGKLVTLSAIARQLEVSMDDVYLAGHFWKMLSFGLNWRWPVKKDGLR